MVNGFPDLLDIACATYPYPRPTLASATRLVVPQIGRELRDRSEDDVGDRFACSAAPDEALGDDAF